MPRHTVLAREGKRDHVGFGPKIHVPQRIFSVEYCTEQMGGNVASAQQHVLEHTTGILAW